VPLHWACGKGHLEMVTYLISQGASINIQNEVSILYQYECFSHLHLSKSGQLIWIICSNSHRTDSPLLIWL